MKHQDIGFTQNGTYIISICYIEAPKNCASAKNICEKNGMSLFVDQPLTRKFVENYAEKLGLERKNYWLQDDKKESTDSASIRIAV
jgi:hypothetical protein